MYYHEHYAKERRGAPGASITESWLDPKHGESVTIKERKELGLLSKHVINVVNAAAVRADKT